MAITPAVVRPSWLPSGRALTERDFAWRHGVVTACLAAHVPLLVVVALLRGQRVVPALLEAVAVGALLAVARGRVRRRTAALSATLGLLTSSTLLVHLFDGMVELHFHYFVAVALVALYQDWRVLAAAVGVVGLQHLVVSAIAPEAVRVGMTAPGGGLLHAGFVLAECAVLVVFWHAHERTRAGQEQMARALYDGQSSLAQRLQETERIRTDLIATVSHEFRTPLTGIRGAALTLRKRGDRLDAEARARLLDGVLDAQERLSRLLENMLTASRATSADPSAVCDVHGVATEVAMLADAERRSATPVSVLVERGTLARIDRQALHQVLANLVDNAQVHGAPGSTPLVTGGRDADSVWVAVSNDGSTMDPASAGRLFEPFAQADSGATRRAEGLGMGLYVVRRLVDVYGGEVEVRSESGWVTVEVRLAAADPSVPGPRGDAGADRAQDVAARDVAARDVAARD